MRFTRSTDRPGLYRDTRGAATTEGVIVAVFLVIVFGLSLYLKARHARVAELASGVRQDVALEAFAGCRDGRAATLRATAEGLESAARPVMPALVAEYASVLERGVEVRRAVRELGGTETYGRSHFESSQRSECNPVVRDVGGLRQVAMRQAYCRSTGNCGP